LKHFEAIGKRKKHKVWWDSTSVGWALETKDIFNSWHFGKSKFLFGITVTMK